MTREEKIEIIENTIIDYMYDDTIVSLYNDANLYGDEIMFMQDFDIVCSGLTPTEIVENLDADFDISDSYFRKGNYDCLESTDDIYEFISDYSMLAEYILESEEDYGCNKISELFEKWEANEEFDKLLDTLQDIEIDKFNAYVESLDDDDRIMFRIEEIIEREENN